MSNTRHVSLWLNNEEGSYRDITAAAINCLQTACDTESHATTARNDAIENLATLIEDYVCKSMPRVGGLWGDLISSALDGVDFEEVARDWLADMEIFSVYSSDDEDAELFTTLDEAKQCLLDKTSEENDPEGNLSSRIEGIEFGTTISIAGVDYTLGVS